MGRSIDMKFGIYIEGCYFYINNNIGLEKINSLSSYSTSVLNIVHFHCLYYKLSHVNLHCNIDFSC
jgi:hypothetical protein